MAISLEMTEYDFVRELRDDEYAGWSVDAARALYNYMLELSEDTGEEVRFDRVAFRCDWSETHIQDVYYEYKHIFDKHDNIESDDYDKQIEVLSEYTNILDIRRASHMGNVLILAF